MYVYARKDVGKRLKQGEYAGALEVKTMNDFRLVKLERKILGLHITAKLDDSLILFPSNLKEFKIKEYTELEGIGAEMEGERYHIETSRETDHLDIIVSSLDHDYTNVIDSNNSPRMIESILRCFGFNVKIDR